MFILVFFIVTFSENVVTSFNSKEVHKIRPDMKRVSLSACVHLSPAEPETRHPTRQSGVFEKSVARRNVFPYAEKAEWRSNWAFQPLIERAFLSGRCSSQLRASAVAPRENSRSYWLLFRDGVNWFRTWPGRNNGTRPGDKYLIHNLAGSDNIYVRNCGRIRRGVGRGAARRLSCFLTK